MLSSIKGRKILQADKLMLLVATGLGIVLAANQFLAVQERHRDLVRRADLYTLQLSIQRFYALKGYYPLSLTDLPNLVNSNCADPKFGGNCASPGYSYQPLTQNGKSGCDNHHIICRNYSLTASHMEATSPLVLASN
jgi:serine/threonine protein kinase HipA of HipAB toxin-antitoxin module